MENKKIKRNQEGLNLFSLLYFCLYQWKKMVCAGIVLAILAAGYKTYNFYSARNDKGQTSYEAEMEKYNIAKGLYDHSVSSYTLSLESMEAAIEELNIEIENEERYCQESPKMQLDPNAYYAVALRLYVDTGYMIMPDMTYQNVDKTSAVTGSYVTEMMSSLRKEELADACGFDSLYVNDIYSVYSSDDCFVNISLIGPSKEFVLAGVEYITKALEDSTLTIKEILGDYRTVLTNYGVSVTASQEIMGYQEAKRASVVEKKSDLIKKKTELAKITEPARFSVSRPSVTRTAMKTAIMGGVAGAVIIVIFMLLMVFISGKMLSGKDLCDQYGLKSLGSYSSKRYRGLTRLFRKWEGKTDASSLERDMALIAQSVANYTEGIEGTILLTGSVSAIMSEKLVSALSAALPGKNVVFGESMLINVDTLSLVKRCDALILVERCYESKYSHIEQELQTALNLNKIVLGVVVEE